MSSISASSTSTAGEDEQPRFCLFLNIPMEVKKVHMIAHYFINPGEVLNKKMKKHLTKNPVQ